MIEQGGEQSRIISFTLPSSVTQKLLKGLITFTAFHGPWKSPVYINAQERFVGDLHFDPQNGDVPATSMTISRIGLFLFDFNWITKTVYKFFVPVHDVRTTYMNVETTSKC